jgi:DNA-binding response OmpR family regulator
MHAAASAATQDITRERKEQTMSTPVDTSPAVAARSTTRRVLVVEDDANLALGVSRMLEADRFAVDVASDGRAGLALLRTGTYELVILDIMLPGMNGYELCRTARRDGVETPVLMLSAKHGEWDIAEGLDLGADDYLTKPFSTVELRARVRALLRRFAHPTPWQTGHLRLEREARRCWQGSTAIDLTGRETIVLTVLFEHLGAVVTKERLLERAWGDGAADTNVVEVYVGRLRRKLARPNGVSDIETIRGEGYRLRDRPAVGEAFV